MCSVCGAATRWRCVWPGGGPVWWMAKCRCSLSSTVYGHHRKRCGLVLGGKITKEKVYLLHELIWVTPSFVMHWSRGVSSTSFVHRWHCSAATVCSAWTCGLASGTKRWVLRQHSNTTPRYTHNHVFLHLNKSFQWSLQSIDVIFYVFLWELFFPWWILWLMWHCWCHCRSWCRQRVRWRCWVGLETPFQGLGQCTNSSSPTPCPSPSRLRWGLKGSVCLCVCVSFLLSLFICMFLLYVFLYVSWSCIFPFENVFVTLLIPFWFYSVIFFSYLKVQKYVCKIN